MYKKESYKSTKGSEFYSQIEREREAGDEKTKR
jgi:hypothetical protein